MVDDKIYFEPDPFTPISPSPTPPAPVTPCQNTSSVFFKPQDDFSSPILVPGTIYYLTITTPHTDSWAFHGPVTTFAALLPIIQETISTSPPSLEKLKRLMQKDEEDEEWDIDACGNVIEKKPSPSFSEKGFTTFVIDGKQAQEYTVLNIIREINGPVAATLPASVYTLTAHGPLLHNFATSASVKTVPSSTSKPKGLASTSRIIGSFTNPAAAKTAAKRVMNELVKNEDGVLRSESWEEAGKGRGLVMALNAEAMWEVRVGYEDDALRGAVERFDAEEKGKGSRRKGVWRLEG